MSSQDLKAQARRLADHLSRVHGVKLKHAAALEAVAATHGAADWNTLSAKPDVSRSAPAGVEEASPGSHLPLPPAAVPQASDWYTKMVARIDESIVTGGPLVLGEPSEERMHRKQLLRIVHDFPRIHEFWSKHAIPSKAAPRCFCCQRSIYEAPVSFWHRELKTVHACTICIPNPPPGAAFGVWLIDDGDYVAAASQEEALAWYDAVHGASDAEEGRVIEPRSLDEPIHTSDDRRGPTKPLRQLVTERLRAGGMLPAVVAHDFGVL